MGRRSEPLYWRENLLYCREVVVDTATGTLTRRWATGYTSTGDNAKATWDLGLELVAEIRKRRKEGKPNVRPVMGPDGKLFFDKPETTEHYKPLIRDITEYYWVNKASLFHKTCQARRSMLNRINRLWGNVPAEDFTEKMVMEEVNRCLTDERARKEKDPHVRLGTCNATLRNILMYLKIAYDWGNKAKDPRVHVALNFLSEKRKIDSFVGEALISDVYVSPQMFEKFYAWMLQHRPALALFYLAVRMTTSRLMELANVMRDDVHETYEENGKTIYWPHYTLMVEDRKTREKKPVNVGIPERLLQALKKTPAWNGHGYLLLNGKGKQWKRDSWDNDYSAVIRAFPSWWRDGGAKGTCVRSGRSGTITDMLDSGVPIEEVQAITGHHSTKSVRRYDKRTKDRLAQKGMKRYWDMQKPINTREEAEDQKVA